MGESHGMEPITPPRRLFLRLLALAAVGGLMSCTLTSPKASAPGTLHQVGFVWLKNAKDRDKIIQAVHRFGREIPEVQSVSVGRPHSVGSQLADTSYDVGFTLTFENEADRQRYAAHPVHVKAAQEVFLPLSRKLRFYHYVAE